jgi:hypothetical protein
MRKIHQKLLVTLGTFVLFACTLLFGALAHNQSSGQWIKTIDYPAKAECKGTGAPSPCYDCNGNASGGNYGCDYGEPPPLTIVETCEILKKGPSYCSEDWIAYGTYRDCSDPSKTDGTCLPTLIVCYPVIDELYYHHFDIKIIFA